MAIVKTQIKGLDEALQKFTPRVVGGAARSAISRAIMSARTEASRKIRSTYTIGKSDVDRYLRVSMPTGDETTRLTATITAGQSFTKAHIPLIQFKAKQSGIQFTRRSGKSSGFSRRNTKPGIVQIQVRKDRGWQSLQHAFIAKMRSGHIGVFERISGKRTARGKSSAIRELTSIDVPLMFAERGVMTATKDKAIDTFNKRFEHELSRAG